MTSSEAASRERDEVFLELTKSICPVCKSTIDAEVNVRDDQVFLRKRCREHGEFEARVYGDAQMYVDAQRFNKPGHQARFHHGDAEAPPLPDACADVVVCECALCALPGKATAAAEMTRVLRPGGRIGLTDITADPDRLEDLGVDLTRAGPLLEAAQAAIREGVLDYVLLVGEKR